MLHPAREPLETLAALKHSIGAYDFAGQYQQDPAPREGGLVRAEHFPRQSPDNVRFDMTVQSWDTAHKTGEHNDYSVCTTWGRTPDRHYHLLDVFRAKLAFPQLVARVQVLHDHYRPGTPIGVSTRCCCASALGPSRKLPITERGRPGHGRGRNRVFRWSRAETGVWGRLSTIEPGREERGEVAGGRQ